ncbi:MAG: NAD(P)H-dependent oxidoreductase subunit E [Saprospiraceae bacterium]|nr:NAD(P)H-dependent oxidoreductase subunit E [Saprospiraceae bacterium]
MSKNISHLSFRKGLQENLFEEIGNLNKVQIQSKEDLKAIADEYLIGEANVFGAASFYDFTREENVGKKVYVCNGSACLNAGTQAELRNKLTSIFNSQEIGEMCCLGRCHENSAFQYENVNYSGNSIEHLDQIVKNNYSLSSDSYAIDNLGSRILTGPAPDPEELILRLKDILRKTPSQVLEEIKLSGLRGRGGAGFPISIKLEACSKELSQEKFIVCNADEGDPGSYSDRYLLEHQPRLVLIGMWIAAYIIGANKGVVYIRAEYPESVNSIIREVVELEKEKITGEKIFGSDFNFEFKVIKAQGAYICGEETALLSSIEGQRPEVRVRPPFPVQEGLFRRPTVVNNVETLANLYYICAQGGDSYKAIGTVRSTGTKLMSFDSAFNRPGIYEVDMGTPLEDVIEKLAKGFKRKIKALHIGGPLGGLVPMMKIPTLSIDFESFANQGFMLGHASIVSLPEEYPMIKYLEHLFEFTAHESCGKCFPCRLGSTRGKELMQKAQSDSDFKIDKDLINNLLDTMKRGSLCALGGGIPLPVMNALQYFPDELKSYLK